MGGEVAGTAEASRPADASPEPVESVSRVPQALVAAAFGLSGAAALIYEVTWTRELSLVLGSTVYGVSIMLAAFMGGLALGGARGGRWADRSRNKVALFAKLEFGVGVLGLLTIPALRFLPSVYILVATTLDPHFWLYLGIQAFFSFLIMIAPTTLMGATFPVVASASLAGQDRTGSSIGDIYSVNTVGAMIGALLGGFLLIPVVGVRGAVFVAAGLNMIVALGIMWRSKERGLWRWVIAAVVVAAIGVFGSTAYPSPGYAAALSLTGRANTYGDIQRMEEANEVIFTRECPYGEVQIRATDDGHMTLVHGAYIEGSNSTIDADTTRLLALVPALTATNPETGLVIGLGTGYTTQAMLSLPFESVETIEISLAVDEASRYFVGDDLADDPRWELTIDDARGHLVRSQEKYDVVTSEPSWPFSDAVANLFTLEFFQLVRARLNPDGVFCQWLPRYLLEREDFMMMYRTYNSVFPENYVWAVHDQEGRAVDLLFVGVKSEDHRAPSDVRDAVVRALDETGGLHDLSFDLFESTETMSDSLTDADVPLNTDDRPLLEYRVLENVVEWNAGG